MKTIAKRETNKSERRSELVDRSTKLQSLMVEANRNIKKLPELNTFLRDNPDLADKISTLAASVKTAMIEKISSRGKGTQLVILEEVMAVTRRLSTDDDSALEKLMIDCVAMCWLRLQYAEHYRTAAMGGGQAYKDIELAEKLLTRAHNRFIRAVESLAKLRKLNQPKSGNSLDRSMTAVKVYKAMSN